MEIKELKTNELKNARIRIEEETDDKSIFTFRDACMSILFDMSGLSGFDSYATVDYLRNYEAISYNEHERLLDEEIFDARIMSYVMWGSVAIIGIDAYGISELFDDIDLRLDSQDGGESIHPKVGKSLYNEIRKPDDELKPSRKTPWGMS